MTLFLGEIDSISDIDLFYHGFQQNVLGVTEQKNQRNADISAGNIEKEIRGYPYDRLLPEKALKSINVWSQGRDSMTHISLPNVYLRGNDGLLKVKLFSNFFQFILVTKNNNEL